MIKLHKLLIQDIFETHVLRFAAYSLGCPLKCELDEERLAWETAEGECIRGQAVIHSTRAQCHFIVWKKCLELPDHCSFIVASSK
ncbi:unnamed protein product [Protopolystoma xenopodis]|uniref:Uncharacterized protein n=1 Tax=Protopolystoma xenopodis TaxID=117903 RepID=A0A3S5AFB3_9PLAT|nr:unnamed protein product [Protopolystoma xenopodis]